MMMGVLVIAFPVSVFSDLWQQELKKVQGFDFGEDDGESPPLQYNSGEQRDDDSGSSAIIGEATPLRPHPTDESYVNPKDNVVMSKKDLREIVGCLRRIEQEQQRLGQILNKYDSFRR